MPDKETVHSWLIDGLHLLTLFAFAVAQPVYGLIGGQPGFFTANQFLPADILLLVLTISIILPLILMIFQFPGLFNKRWQKVTQAIWVFILSGLIVSSIVSYWNFPDMAHVVFTLSIAVGLTVLYHVKHTVKRFLCYLSPSVLIFPLIFLVSGEVPSMLLAREESFSEMNQKQEAYQEDRQYPPVVMVILDELPLSALLDVHGEIDSKRYPNLAAFAEQATWFRNTNSVSAYTLWAVPAILTGQMPSKPEAPTKVERHVNLFTMLGNTHSMYNVDESHTSLCPQDLCIRRKKHKPLKKLIEYTLPDMAVIYLHRVAPHGWRKLLPDIENNWGNFGWGRGKPIPKQPSSPPALISHPKTLGKKIEEDESQPASTQGINKKKAVPNHERGLFNNFLSRMEKQKPQEKPPLFFMHFVFPHLPYNYLPSGKFYAMGSHAYPTKWESERQIHFVQQRHLLQVAATDTMLGDLFERLKALGYYDRSLIVIVADHGVSWKEPGEERRILTKGNYPDLIQVPFFIKLPGQSTSHRIERQILTVDVLPTLSALLEVPLPGEVDGQNALDPAYRESEKITITDHLGDSYTFPLDPSLFRDSLERKLARFGSGDPTKLFTTAPLGHLVGKPVGQVDKVTDFHFVLYEPEHYENVNLQGMFVPAMIFGRVSSDGLKLPRDIAIAVNDVVWCTYPLIEVAPDQKSLTFWGLVPEKSFRNGKNEIRIFAVSREGNDELFEIPSLNDKGKSLRDL